DLSEAGDWYARAAEEGKNRFGDLNSSRRNARLILNHWKEDPDWIDKYLRVPSVMVFAGHMIDHPHRAEPRFPKELESFVRNEIQQRIEKLQPGFGFSSAACGSDILFLEAMLDRDAEVSIVLPYNEEEFIRDSVEIIPNSNWRARFDRVLKQATSVITASTERLEIGGISYEFCNELMLGLGTIRARQLDTDLIPLAVWNGTTGDGPGGAASAIELWRSAGYEPAIVDLPKIRGMGFQPMSHRQDADATPGGDSFFASRIVAILFADAV